MHGSTSTPIKFKDNLTIFSSQPKKKERWISSCLVLIENFYALAITVTYIDSSKINLISEVAINYLTKILSSVEVVVSPFLSKNYLQSYNRTPRDSNVEPLCVRVKAVKNTVTISVTFRPPAQSLNEDIEIYSVLHQFLDNDSSVILEDFNVPNINWTSLTGTKGNSHRIIESLENI